MKISLSFSGSSVLASYPALASMPAAARRRYAALVAIAMGMFLSASSPMSAEEKRSLEISLAANRVVRHENRDILEEASKARPGDVVQYQALYRNAADAKLLQLAPTLPIPEGTVFLASSVKPAPAEASLDGRTYEAFPIKRPRKLPSGETIMAPVPASSYRALRWTLGELAPGSTFMATARVQIVQP